MEFKDPLKVIETLMHERPRKLRLAKFVLLQQLLCWTIISTNNWQGKFLTRQVLSRLYLYVTWFPRVFSMRSVFDDKGFKFVILLFYLYYTYYQSVFITIPVTLGVLASPRSEKWCAKVFLRPFCHSCFSVCTYVCVHSRPPLCNCSCHLLCDFVSGMQPPPQRERPHPLHKVFICHLLLRLTFRSSISKYDSRLYTAHYVQVPDKWLTRTAFKHLLVPRLISVNDTICEFLNNSSHSCVQMRCSPSHSPFSFLYTDHTLMSYFTLPPNLEVSNSQRNYRVALLAPALCMHDLWHAGVALIGFYL